MKKIFLLLLTVSLLVGGPYSTGWAGDNLKQDPVSQGWSLLDLLVARPLSVLAGIGGSAVFVAALPFTIPSGTTRDAANMFIVQPFQFSFNREVPDKDI
jgi:hypothetical protein